MMVLMILLTLVSDGDYGPTVTQTATVTTGTTCAEAQKTLAGDSTMKSSAGTFTVTRRIDCVPLHQ